MAGKIKNVSWKEDIRNRANLARQWQEAWQTHQELAEKFRYVRLQGDGFSAISISRENPCGRLITINGEQAPEWHPTLHEAIQCAQNVLPTEAPLDYRPKKDKKEHRIQAFLIRQALLNDKAMHGVFSGFEEDFDDLWFVTDELPAGEHRADIIAIGRKADRYFPVFIELKVARLLTELTWQLEGIREAMKLVEDDFIKYLAAASGIPAEKIDFDKHRLMLIWPAPNRAESAAVDGFRRDKGGITAVYEEDVVQKQYRFIRWPKV